MSRLAANFTPHSIESKITSPLPELRNPNRRQDLTIFPGARRVAVSITCVTRRSDHRNRGEMMVRSMMVGFLASFNSLPFELHGSSFGVSLVGRFTRRCCCYSPPPSDIARPLLLL